MSLLSSAPQATESAFDKLVHSETLLRSGDPEAAAGIASNILLEDDTNVGALEILAKAQWQCCRLLELLDTLTRLIRLNPYEPGYHALRGATLQALGRYPDSIRSFARSSSMPSAQSALRALEAWQCEAVRDLMQRDAVFKAQYEQNPTRACEERGFAVQAHRRTGEWILAERFAASRNARPS